MPKKTLSTKRPKRIRLAIIAADFNKDIVHPMMKKAEQTAVRLGCDIACTITVPGSFEIPLVLDALLQRSDIDCAVALGYIEKGETLHGEVMGHAVCRTLIDLQLVYGKPVGLGIIGPGATLEQAQKRNVAYGEAAVAAAVRSLACVEEAQT